jgi:hypothetical protein
VTERQLDPEDRSIVESASRALFRATTGATTAHNHVSDLVAELSAQHDGETDQALAEAAGITVGRLRLWVHGSERRASEVEHESAARPSRWMNPPSAASTLTTHYRVTVVSERPSRHPSLEGAVLTLELGQDSSALELFAIINVVLLDQSLRVHVRGLEESPRVWPASVCWAAEECERRVRDEALERGAVANFVVPGFAIRRAVTHGEIELPAVNAGCVVHEFDA